MSNPTTLPVATKADRIEKALAFAVAYGGIDGAHHKDWVIDQMVRALTGCPVEEHTIPLADGTLHVYHDQGESANYKTLVAEACDGSDGPNTYTWETGIAP